MKKMIMLLALSIGLMFNMVGESQAAETSTSTPTATEKNKEQDAKKAQDQKKAEAEARIIEDEAEDLESGG